MILLLIVACFSGYFLQDFFFTLTDLSGEYHQSCLDIAPSSLYRSQYQALVCGERLPHDSRTLDLKTMGIIHLFVVSGAHLVFLSKMIAGLSGAKREKSFLSIFVLLAFVVICQFQMPALRAWVAIVVQFFNERFKWQLSSSSAIFISVLFCLSLAPTQLDSYSLVLSWIAALAIRLGRNAFTQSVLVFLLILPVTQSFAALSPWSVVINSFLVPIIGQLLFPLSILSFLHEGFVKITDPLWDRLFRFAQLYSWLGLPPLQMSIQTSKLTLWLYALGLQTGTLLWQRRRGIIG